MNFMRIIWLGSFLLAVVPRLVFCQIEENEKKCHAGDGLACAKAAYHFKKSDQGKAFEFYKKGCELKEQSACYNMNNYDPKDAYFKKVDRAIAPHASKIRACYSPNEQKKKYSSIQFKEKFYTAEFSFPIDSEGNAEAIEIKTSLDDDFKKCSSKILKNIHYPLPKGFRPHYRTQMQFTAFE